MKNIDFCELSQIQDMKSIHGKFNAAMVHKDYRTSAERQAGCSKVITKLGDAITKAGLQDGMTISFHHHFRNGDHIVNMVMDCIANMGFKNLVLAASSLTECHAPLIKHIQNGVIRRIETSGLRGELAEAISRGLMDEPVIFRSHGGRAYAIETGEMQIDVAFLGAPSCDPYGNANGYSRVHDNGIQCGSMGYAKCDAQYARKVIILTDNLVPYPNIPFGIPESDVDYIVVVDSIGDPKGIMSGATRYTTNPKELLIAQTCTEVIKASGYFKNGFSMQMGSGGASLAVARYLREEMLAYNIRASFALGGITEQIVEMLEKGLINRVLDVQSFDLKAAESLKNNRFHQQISASYYASYNNAGAAVNQLDLVVLSALEIDTDFNVNVLTGSDGVIRGAIGGHPDTAMGASVSIIVAPLMRGRIPTVVERVNTVVTPGDTVDILVTDQGVAVNPIRQDLIERIHKCGIQTMEIRQLKERAERMVGKGLPIQYTDKPVAVVAYRDNSVIDIVYQIKE